MLLMKYRNSELQTRVKIVLKSQEPVQNMEAYLPRNHSRCGRWLSTLYVYVLRTITLTSLLCRSLIHYWDVCGQINYRLFALLSMLAV